MSTSEIHRFHSPYPKQLNVHVRAAWLDQQRPTPITAEQA